MASLKSYQNSNNTIIITILFVMVVVLLHPLLCPVSCFKQPQPAAIPPRDQFFEEKNRLGSMPPTCHNKCNQCHPCMAVQVPNLPSHDRVVGPGVTRIAAMEGLFLQANNRYSNYKTLSWKCHCGGHFFNP